MVIRFFILQTHYRSTLDFSNEALLGAEKGLKRLWEAFENLQKLNAVKDELNETAGDPDLDRKVVRLVDELSGYMNDDFSTARVLANLFELAPVINSIRDRLAPAASLSRSTFDLLQTQFRTYIEDILGLQGIAAADHDKLQGVMQLLVDIRREAKKRKDFVTSDKIRNQLAELGIVMKDEKNGEISWNIE
jgi:cysteinyl-tRNA synthetase